MMTSVSRPDLERGDERRATFEWLLRLRWTATVGQLVTLSVVRWLLDVPIVLAPLLAVIGFEAASNLFAARVSRRRAITELRLGSLIALDVLILAALLYYSGGAQNPFSFLFLVQVALAAMALSWRWTWGLVALALTCLAGLYALSVPLPMTHMQMMRLHLYGMWVASGVAGAFIVTFVGRVSGELRRSRAHAQRERMRAERTQRLASLATLAAGAAHELATPLGTIALCAEELEREVRSCKGAAHLLEDVELVRAEVRRCRDVLDELSTEAARSPGESIVTLDVAKWLQRLSTEAGPRVVLDLPHGLHAQVKAPRRALSRALRALIDNALQASAVAELVLLGARREDTLVVIEVADSGEGMDEATLARVGEPFFTTKALGEGMGLGVLLTRTVIEEAGGSLSYRSRRGEGTVARVELPVEDA